MKVQYGKLAEINDTVDKLEDPVQRTILVKHYFSGKTWRDVASETHYSERTVRNIHAAALAEIDKLIKSLP
jgi:DNA-directed RNA polymerase specialized sigma24 family protein